MILKVYSVFDSKVQSFMQPFYCQSKGQALRGFTEVANDKQHTIGKYPEDCTLFELGEFDDATGHFSLFDTPMSIGLAIEYINAEQLVKPRASIGARYVELDFVYGDCV